MTNPHEYNYDIIEHTTFDKLRSWYRDQLPFFHSISDGVITTIPKHIKYATDMTKYGHRNMANRKSRRAVERVIKDVRSAREEDVILKQSEDNLPVSAV